MKMKKIVLCFLSGVLALGMLYGCGKGDNGGESRNISLELSQSTGESKSGSENENGSILDGAVVFEDKEEGRDSADGSISVVLDGFGVQVPLEYGCFIDDERGPIVYRDDLFTLMLGIRDTSYEEKIKDPESFMQGALSVGGEITKELEEIEIDEKPYAYYTYTLNGDDFVVSYTAAGDSDKRLCTQVVKTSDISDMEVMERFAEIAVTAKETDKPNTEQEDLVSVQRVMESGTVKTESTLEYGGTTITFGIEPEYYSIHTEADETGTVEYFEKASGEWMSCFLIPGEGILDARSYIEERASNQEEAEVESGTVEKNGHTFYYSVRRYTYEDSEYQQVEAACDVGDGLIYSAGFVAIDSSETYSLDDIMDFITIEEK